MIYRMKFWVGCWLIAWLVATFEATSAAFSQWANNEAYHHALFVVPVFFYWLYLAQGTIGPIAQDKRWLVLSFLSALVYSVGSLVSINPVQQFGALLLLLSLPLFLYGYAVINKAWFPMGLLFFGIPVGDELLPVLQQITAGGATVLLEATGFTVWREGFFIRAGSGDYWVAEACAGLKFLLSTVFYGYCVSYFCFSRPRQMIGFFFFSCLIPIPANVLRVYITIVVGETYGIQAVEGFDHIVYGWVLFAAIFVLITFLALRWGDQVRKWTPLINKDANATLNSGSLVPMFLPILMIILIEFWPRTGSGEALLVDLQSQAIAGVQLRPATFDYPKFDGAMSVAAFEEDGFSAFIASFSGASDSDAGSSLHQLYDPKCHVIASTDIRLSERVGARLLQLQHPREGDLFLVYWIQTGEAGAVGSLAVTKNKLINILRRDMNGEWLIGAFVSAPRTHNHLPAQLIQDRLIEFSKERLLTQFYARLHTVTEDQSSKATLELTARRVTTSYKKGSLAVGISP